MTDLNSLKVYELKNIAKAAGIVIDPILRKADLIQILERLGEVPAARFSYEDRYGLHYEEAPADLSAAITTAEEELNPFRAKLAAASEARRLLPAGSSRARITSANARYATWAEAVNLRESRLAALKALA